MIPRGARIQSPNIKQKRKARMRLRLIVFSFLILFLFGGVIAFFYIPQTIITKIIVDGESAVTEEDIKSTVEEEITGKYGLLIPKRNIFVYPRKRIEDKLLENTRISEAKVSFFDFQTIEVVIRERKPDSLWCGVEIYEGEDEGRCFFADETGFIFSKAPDFSGSSFLRIIGGAVDSESPFGERIAEESFFKTLLFFKSEVDREVSKINKIHFKGNGIIDLYFDVGGKIVINNAQDLGDAFQNIKVLVGSPSFAGKDENGKLIVEYIDLQNTEKVFYKVKK